MIDDGVDPERESEPRAYEEHDGEDVDDPGHVRQHNPDLAG